MVEKEPPKWKLLFSKRAVKDAKKLGSANLKSKADKILDLLETNPLTNPPPFKKLIGTFKGYYSRRLNLQHRIVYKIDARKKEVIILAMWTHYDD